MLPLTVGLPDRRSGVGDPVRPLRGPALRHRGDDRAPRSASACSSCCPVDFPYWVFAVVLFLTGLTMASFGSPNRAGVMNSLPPQHRGAGSGMNTTFQNSAQVLSIGIFFTLMIVGLSSSLPAQPLHGLVAHGVPAASGAARRPPAAGVDAVRRLPRLQPDPAPDRRPRRWPSCPPAQQAALTGRSFFPGLISAPFRAGLHAALDFAIVASLLAAGASWMRGGHVRLLERSRSPSPTGWPAAGPRRDGRSGTGRRRSRSASPDDLSGAAIAQVDAG